MLPGPIFRREVKAAARRRDLFVVRIVLATLLALVVLGAWAIFRWWSDRDQGVYPAGVLRDGSGLVFAIAAFVSMVVPALLALGAVSPGIAEEREKDTLPTLLLTRLTRLELVLTKLAGRLMPSFLLMLTGLPLLLLSARFAALPWPPVVEVLAVMVGTTIVAGSLAILASARHQRVASAGGEAIFWTMVWLMGLPMVSRLPARSGTLWGDLLVELRRLCAEIAPSSPFSLLTNPSWYTGAGLGDLSGRLATMLLLQAILIALAISAAVACLRLREPHPYEWDPHRGYRPPVGDDPIFWREYDLPWRGSRAPQVVILARQLAIILRATVGWLLQLVGVVLALGVLIGLVLAAGWFGYFAARELWEQGYGSTAPGSYAARDALKLFLCAATGMLGGLPLLSAASAVMSRFTIERDKKTWEPLLTTPLTGAEILSSKVRVSAQGLWSAGRWLIPFWGLGIACDALHPLGVLVAAGELLLGAWLGLALGAWLGLRPGSTTQAANSAAALWSMGLSLPGGVWIVAPLAAYRELARLRAWDDRLFWLAIVADLAAGLAVGISALVLTRRCYRHFDEWAGRPHRAGGPAIPRSAP